MTFDTFDTYNTDEAYNDKGTTAKGLVAAYKKDNPEGSKDDFYSKLNATWKEDKNGYVKAAVDEAFKETPKAEKETVIETPKKEEVTEKVTETAPEEKKTEAPKAKTSTLSKGEKDYIKKQDEFADTALNTTLNDVGERRGYNWEQQYETARKAGEAFSRIDDKLVEQLPTFMLKRYVNGEFGDPKSNDAKLRLAHFMLNGVQSKLKNASNAAAIAAGRSPMFADTTSDYEKYQQSNLAKGMENRWKKYEAETENAIKLASNESMTEQEARLEAEKIANDKKMATKWNMMDARQKVDLMTIKKEIGKLVGNMDLSEIADFMTGEAISGELSKDEAIAIGVAQLVKKSPELLAKLPDGDIKTAVLGLFGGGSVESTIASLGGSADSNGNKTNFTGNIQNYKGIDGNEISFDFRDPKAKDKIDGEISKLKEKYANGEIDAETFKAYYDPLYAEGKKHLASFTTPSSDSALKVLNNDKLETLESDFKGLNKKAKSGELTLSEYKKQLEELKIDAEKYGATKEMLEYITKEAVPDKTITKALEKKSKKK